MSYAAGPDRVFRGFANLHFWELVLPDVLGIEVLYQDACHQEFKMTVSRPGGPETVRSIRVLCAPRQKSDIFQPEPPPNFRAMSGVWSFLAEARRRQGAGHPGVLTGRGSGGGAGG